VFESSFAFVGSYSLFVFFFTHDAGIFVSFTSARLMTWGCSTGAAGCLCMRLFSRSSVRPSVYYLFMCSFIHSFVLLSVD
jgi:hypothetical protein